MPVFELPVPLRLAFPTWMPANSPAQVWCKIRVSVKSLVIKAFLKAVLHIIEDASFSDVIALMSQLLCVDERDVT